jgi:AcrR family transcriptional regulator
MSRKRVLTGGKRDELISAALKLFMENGYESTSVRMILNEVNGEVGMFYHYFKSKDELFEAAMRLHFQQYSERFGKIVQDDGLSLSEQIGRIFQLFKITSESYLQMSKNGGLHWTVELALREKTLDELEPHIAVILKNAVKAELMRQPDVPFNELAAFLVHGIAGIMHQESVKEISSELFLQKKKSAIWLIANTLRISPDTMGGYQL